MNLLLVETSTGACSVALTSERGSSAARHQLTEREHTALVLPMIGEVLGELGLRPNELDYVGYGAGPGSFTGVRIAVAVAQGLAIAAGAQVVAVSSLAGVAQAALGCEPERSVLVAQDARLGEVYAGAYRLVDGLATPVLADCLLAPEELPLDSDWILAGNAWRRIPVLAEYARQPELIAERPSAADMLGLARSRIDSGLATDAARAEPIYIRNSVARPPGSQVDESSAR